MARCGSLVLPQRRAPARVPVLPQGARLRGSGETVGGRYNGTTKAATNIRRSKDRRLQTQVAGYNHALDFAGALVDGDYAGIAVHALDIGFTRIAYAAVNLDGF